MQVIHTQRPQTGTLRITINRTYTVVQETETRYYIQNDAGSVQGYDKRLFTIVPEGPVGPVGPVDVDGVTETPTRTTRRGRPTNAEIAARNATQQAPVETTAQRRAREAREREEAARAEQERIEAARIAEETRRGRLLTEEDRIASIETIATIEASDYPSHTAATKIVVNISYETKERINDNSNRREVSAYVNLYKDNCFSCGIKTLVNIESFINAISQLPDYQQEDFENLKTLAIKKAIRAVIDRSQGWMNAAMTICSVTNRNEYQRHLENAGFTTVVEPRRNPNSSNHINVMVITH